MPIPPGYASVSVEKIFQPDFEELELEISRGDGEKTLKDALHGTILWPNYYIVIIPKNDGSPRDPLEPGPSSPLPVREPLQSSLGPSSLVPTREPLQSSPGLSSSVPTLAPLQSSPGHHHHYLLAHLLRKNHTTIREKQAPAITMMTSLPVHLSNHRPQIHKGLERNLSSQFNHQRKKKMTSKEQARAKEDR
jgi:hypothetical protein